MMTCEVCGAETRKKVYKDGVGLCVPCYDGTQDWKQGWAPSAFRDEIPGGVVCENYGPQPIRFNSHSERRAYMKTHGLNEKEKFCPLPGTDKDPQGIPNPKGYMDPYTLKNGMELLLRAHNSSSQVKEFDAVRDGVVENLQTGVMTERDATAVASGDTRRQSRLFRRMQHGH